MESKFLSFDPHTQVLDVDVVALYRDITRYQGFLDRGNVNNTEFGLFCIHMHREGQLLLKYSPKADQQFFDLATARMLQRGQALMDQGHLCGIPHRRVHDFNFAEELVEENKVPRA